MRNKTWSIENNRRYGLSEAQEQTVVDLLHEGKNVVVISPNRHCSEESCQRVAEALKGNTFWAFKISSLKILNQPSKNYVDFKSAVEGSIIFCGRSYHRLIVTGEHNNRPMLEQEFFRTMQE